MKKYPVLFLILVFLMSIGGCGKSKTYKIGISQCSIDDWRVKMNDEILREAMLHDDVEVEIRSANDNSEKQIEDIEYFVENGFDVIVVAPNEKNALTPVIKKINEEGKPVIIFDRDISEPAYTQHIGVDNRELGRSAARYSLSLLPEGLKVIEIFGLPGSTPAEERSEGFDEIIQTEGGKILAEAPANWREDLAEGIADSLIRLYPEVNLIFAHNDRMAIGASNVANKMGRDDIKIIGIDAAPAIGIKAVSDNIIDATFLYPTGGHVILREAIKIAKGEPFEREVMLPVSSAVDSTNADILLLQNETVEEDTKKVIALKDQLDSYIIQHNTQTALVYAIFAILILLFGVLFLVLRTVWSHRRHQAVLLSQNKLLEEERDKQKELNEKLEEATNSKMVFFTNVSHDLRTPLTLIAEPVAQLKDARNLDPNQRNLLKIADKNVKILQRLINHILDFRKFELNKLKLNLSEIDFGKILGDWLESFHTVAKKRNIKLTYNPPLDRTPLTMAIDVEKMERVIFNLISNALKYSPDNSTITVSYNHDGDNLKVMVADTGYGINQEDIVNIFDSFFQVEKIKPQGSGIGLSLTKAFVELHDGTIEVESEFQKGSVFTITLPIRHVADVVEETVPNITRQDVEIELEEVEADKEFKDDKPVLLVIDDNKDIRELVALLMKDEYNILTASNGKEGIRKAARYVPDLIICDVMMPGMDGMDCCSHLKAETITSHIPVLMLTACSLDEQRVQGYESGADGYLAKPFSSAVLRSRVASLIANRKRIKETLGSVVIVNIDGKEKIQKINNKIAGDVDNDFYNRFLSLFEEKMGDPNLNVETLAGELGFERTQFYRKIKALTNYSPVELMRNIRLKKARTLLQSTDKTISEICYEVGFSTPAYFSKCYREQFGETPSETRNITS